MNQFIPPKDNPFVLQCTRLLLPALLKHAALEVHIAQHCISTLAMLKDTQTVLMINHSDRFDPLVVFELAKECGEDFNYLASIEGFNRFSGFAGLIMQNCGTYSVVRGEPEDLVSRDYTRELIATGNKKLVMFSEGDVTGRDDVIMPLKKDGLRNIFAAQQSLLASEIPKPVYILPVAMYFEVPSSSEKLLEESISRLELFFRMPSFRQANLDLRLNRIVSQFIGHFENFYGIEFGTKLGLDKRLLLLCRQVIKGLSHYIGLNVEQFESEAVMLYSLRAKFQRLDSACSCNYCQQLNSLDKQRLKVITQEVDRLQQFLILASTLQQRPASLEGIWRIVDRLEQLTKQSSVKGERSVWVEAAQPISILDLYPSYQTNEGFALQTVDHLVRSALGDVMRELKQHQRIYFPLPQAA